MKKFLALVLALAAASVLVACGPSQTPGALTPEQTAAWEGMHLRVAGYRLFNDDPLNYEYAAGAEKFAEKYKTQPIEFLVGGGAGADDDLVAAVTSGDPWDVQLCYGISALPAPIIAGVYTPLTDYINLDDERIDKVTVEATRYNGELYGVSNINMQEFSYACYNETWFRELGVKTPHERFADGEWDTDNMMEMVAELKTKGAKTAMNPGRPNVVGRYMSKFHEDGTAEITYDSQENVDWLNMWRDLIYTSQYKLEGTGEPGSIATRKSAFFDEVFPNLIKWELSKDTTDTLRYIHFPQQGTGVGTYFTDCHFMVPTGVSEEKIPAAVELGIFMGKEKGDLCDAMYKENMTEEDYKLMHENLDNGYFIPQFFDASIWPTYSAKFLEDCAAGKPVTAHIQENLGALQAACDDFNAKVKEMKARQ